MNNILPAALSLSGLGIAFGVSLAIAAKKFCVVTDPRLEKIYRHLPGTNCGVCGMAGCLGFAEGLIQGTCTIERCAVSAEAVREEIADILGVEAKTKVKMVAVLHCHGGSKVKERFIYQGIEDCTPANLVLGGQKECVFGCLGFGTCVKVCPFGAIKMNAEGLPVVDEDKCTACGKCVAGCPKKLFSLVPQDKVYALRCKSLDLGKAVLDVCAVGCIGCRKCEKACPTGAIKVADNLAVIDYRLCENRGECFRICPTNCIAKKERKQWSNLK